MTGAARGARGVVPGRPRRRVRDAVLLGVAAAVLVGTGVGAPGAVVPAAAAAAGPGTGEPAAAPGEGVGSLAELRAYQVVARAWDLAARARRAPESTSWRTVSVGTGHRRYLLSVPPGASAAPLVIAFHGLRQHAGPFATDTGLVGATRSAGEVLAVPESHGPAFNDGRLGPRGPRDLALATAIVDQLAARGVVDPDRVTVTGFSNGAGMAMRVAAERSERVAAVVSVSGSLIRSDTAPRPTLPVEAVLVHGTADPVQPWRGRADHGIMSPAYVSVPDTTAAWTGVDAAGAPSQTVVRARDPRAGLRTVRVRRWRSPGRPPVTSYVVVGMGHAWPVTRLTRASRSDVVQAPLSATRLVVRTAATAGSSRAPWVPRQARAAAATDGES